MATRAVWCQKSFGGALNSVEEQHWRAVVENPFSANLMTVKEFIEKCSLTHCMVNDVVFVGTFASHQDYQMFVQAIKTLSSLRRFAIVDAHVNMFQFMLQSTMTAITDIAFRSCRLSQVPVNLLMFVGFQLQSIDLSNNYLRDLTTLSNLFGNNHKLLKVDLSRNQFSTFPLVLSIVSSLTTLDISHNRLSRIETDDISRLVSLKHLDLSNNCDLKELPDELFALPSLNHMDLTGLNSLVRPPYSLAKNGLQAIKKYYADKAKKGWLEGKKV
ncbi:leucine-rich repeat-containing protein 40-like [Watersipora subatra]|uniref:leucine-rich repeat-containing protein 40-like n=1 Tax=Watersipora subatra TaxID=2589382 RepID=UPI00355B4BAA